MTDYDDDIFNNDLENNGSSKNIKPKQDLFEMEKSQTSTSKQVKKERVRDSIPNNGVNRQRKVAPLNAPNKSEGYKFRKSIDSSLPEEFVQRFENVPIQKDSNGQRSIMPNNQSTSNNQRKGQNRLVRHNPNEFRGHSSPKNSNPIDSRSSQNQKVQNPQIPRNQHRPVRPMNPKFEGETEPNMKGSIDQSYSKNHMRHRNPQIDPRHYTESENYHRVRPMSFEEFSREELKKQEINRKRNSVTDRNKRMVVAIGVLALIVILSILAISISNLSHEDNNVLKVNISDNEFVLPNNVSIINQSDSEVNFKLNGTKCVLKEISESDTESYLTNVTESNYYVDKVSNDAINLTTYSFINGVKNTSGYIVLFHKNGSHYLFETYKSGILESDFNTNLINYINEFYKLNS